MAHAHLHDHERLLCSIRPSGAALGAVVVRTLIDGIVGAAAGWGAALLLAGLADIAVAPVAVAACAALVVAAVTGWSRVGAWRRAELRVTTDRVLLQYPSALLYPSRMNVRWVSRTGGTMRYIIQPFGTGTLTVKWSQFQEAQVARPSLLDLFWRSRPLLLRYGSADAEREVVFPSLPYASDLKHYLDKVDSAVRSGQAKDMRPFVLKPKGQRD